MEYIQTFASLTLPEFTGFLTVIIAMLAGFYALLRFVLNNAEKTTEADRDERKALSTAISDMAEGMQAVATSNERIACESEKRNGHLAEISVENKNQILTAIHNQTVEHEKVINKE